jgi:hypothetical protein
MNAKVKQSLFGLGSQAERGHGGHVDGVSRRSGSPAFRLRGKLLLVPKGDLVHRESFDCGGFLIGISKFERGGPQKYRNVSKRLKPLGKFIPCVGTHVDGRVSFPKESYKAHRLPLAKTPFCAPLDAVSV